MMTPEDKAERARQRLLEKAKEYQLGTYSNKFVAPLFQRMVRAEYAADTRVFFPAVVDGRVQQVKRCMGECVCVTCGKVATWTGNSIGGGEIETGHFVASRRASILYEPTNSHPQCKVCNNHMSGNQGCYEMWMRAMYGQDEIDRLRRLKNASITFDRFQLVDMRIAFQARLKAAIERMTA